MVFKKKVDLTTRLRHRNIARLVQTIIVQAQRPIVLTGGPFYILSLETFRTVSNATTFILQHLYFMTYVILLKL